ncbi:MAG: hypothetical protein JWR23_2111 [Mucilaginibacter sp.]|nr:hypothetical protein [Mucilaginibacter sp.]
MRNSFLKSPLYAKGEKRVVERSKDRVSEICERTVGVNSLVAITHPDIAARKEGKIFIS